MSVEEAIINQVEVLEQENFEVLMSSGLQQRYIDIYEAIIKAVPEPVVKLLQQLDEAMIEIEQTVQERSFRFGLATGMRIRV